MNTTPHFLSGGSSSQIPEIIVVHAMGENIIDEDSQVYSAADWLEKLGLSAHRLVQLNDGIIKCREDEQGAWHAKGFNTNSLGIEFLVEGNHNLATFYERIKEPYLTEDQFEDGVAQIVEWVIVWGIKIEKIFEHSRIDPKRKRDPGDGFPFEEMIKEVKRRIA